MNTYPRVTAAPFTLVLVLLGMAAAIAETIYQTPELFLGQVFEENVPEPRIIWLTGERGKLVKEILGHKPDSLRTRYWTDGDKTAWILQEIGKERPITVGIVISALGIERLRILVYRESRGAEVRFPFFTDQFTNAKITTDMQLDRRIDNITGATLSVTAIRRISKLALFLHQEVTR